LTGLRPWWEEYPGVLQAEEEDLARLGGQPAVLNDGLLASARVREYALRYTDDAGVAYDLRVTYSDLHPFFRVEVASDVRLDRHRQPFSGQLCLLRSGTRHWDVTETAAELIRTQLPQLLADQEPEQADDPTSPVAEADEARFAHVEPIVGYYRYEPNTVVRVDGAWPDLTESDRGTILIGLDGPDNPAVLRGTILEVRDESGSLLRRADQAVAALFDQRIEGRWCRLPERPREDGGDAVLNAGVAVRPDLAAPHPQRVAGGSLDVTAVVFTDDIQADLKTGAVSRGDAWIFVVRGRGLPAAAPGGAGKGKPGRSTPSGPRIGPYLARAYRAGRDDMLMRIPNLAPLRTKKIALFGAGGIGAPSMIEFAKAGVEAMSVIEADFLDPGNAPRWPLGYLAAGQHKLLALLNLINAQWPYTSLDLKGVMLGGVRTNGKDKSHSQLVAEVVQQADLIYDATAEPGVNYFLSELAKSLSIPYVVVSATEGGWGGMVARFWPAPDRACWTCLMHHIQDHTVPLPPADPEPATQSVWPAGCTDPTFSGTGFDVAAVGLAGVRLAAATLCAGEPGAYPPAKWDYAVYAFRSETETFGGGATTYVIDQHPDCEPCQNRRSG